MVRNKDVPITEDSLPLAVEMFFCIESLRCAICVETIVIWSIAPKSIIHVLLETHAEIFKALPQVFVIATNAEHF